MVNLPTGVNVQGQVTINNNSGTLTLAGSNATVAGTYSTLTLAIDGTTSAAFTLTISAPVITYTIGATTITSFGSLPQGYTQPEGQTVTVTNTGTGSVTLSQPTATNYDIGTLSATSLAAGATATFTVRPKAGLTVGTHNETITISGTNGASTSVNAEFTVTATTAKTVSVGEQIGTLNAGTAGSVTFQVTTANIANGSTITLNNTNSVAGISLGTATTTGASTTVSIAITQATPHGSHPLTLTIDEVTSASFNLVVGTSKTVTVAAQVGALNAGTAGTVTFTVTTANIATGSTIALNNTNSVAGISLGTATTTGNTTTVSISTTAATPQGSHPLTLTID
jgi:hypothetical protein